MADELKITCAMRFTKSSTDVRLNFLNALFTVSGTDYVSGTQTIGTSEEALVLGDCSAGGYIVVKNTDATNYVSFRAATGGTNMVRLNAGEIALFRFDATGAAAPFAIANTAPVTIQYLLIEP